VLCSAVQENNTMGCGMSEILSEVQEVDSLCSISEFCYMCWRVRSWWNKDNTVGRPASRPNFDVNIWQAASEAFAAVVFVYQHTAFLGTSQNSGNVIGTVDRSTLGVHTAL